MDWGVRTDHEFVADSRRRLEVGVSNIVDQQDKNLLASSKVHELLPILHSESLRNGLTGKPF